MYKCSSCGAEILSSDMVPFQGIKCTRCGARILYKIRPPVVKRIYAR
ncbi:MAG: DNA-directed RNA polymerase subunit P [Candidatus Helarchaeota archaeon]